MCTIGQRLLKATLVAALLLASAPAFVQRASAGEGIGIVTAIQGQAAVSRASLPQPATLRFKDDVFFRDEISTRERSTVRLLLGGRGTLTIREQSQVTLDESVTPDGARRSVLSLIAGKIGAAVAHALMRPGESVEIHTPNAVAAVRGTVLIAEHIPPQRGAANPQPVLLASASPGPFLAQAPGGAGGTSNFFVLAGQVTITPQGQPPVTLGPLQAVTVTATPGGVQAGAVQNITPAQAAQAAQGLEAGKPHTGEAESSKTAKALAQVAAALANIILQATTGETAPSTLTAPGAPTNTVAPVVPQPVTVGENVLPGGAILALDNVTLGVAAGSSLATFGTGAPNPVTPLALSGGGTAVVTAPLLMATGDPITHTGAILTLDNSAAIVGASSDTTTALVDINGTTVTNTGGAVFSLDGGSVLTTFGPVLRVKGDGSASLAGVMSMGGGSVVALGPADALVIESGSTLTATDALFSLTGESLLTTYEGGSLVSIDPSTLTLSAPILSASGSDVVLGGPLLRAVDSTVTGSQPLVLLQSGSTLSSLAAPVLDLTNSTFDLGSQPVVKLLGGSTFATDVGPIIRVSGGSLTADALGITDGAGNTWDLTGTILDLTNTTVHLRVMGTEPSGSTDSFSHNTLTAGEPAIRMTNSNLTLTGAGKSLWHFDADSDGVALIATNTSGAQKTISLTGPLLDLDANSSAIDLSSPDPLATLSEMTVQQTGTNGLIEVRGGSVTVHASLLQMDNTSATGLNSVAGSLLKISEQGDLEGSISDPLIKIIRGTHAIGSATGSGAGSILDIIGVNNCDGLCQALSWGGTILRAENATIDLSGSGNAIRVDTASVDTATAVATKPIIDLINSTLNTSTSGDSTTGAIHLYSSNVTSYGPVFGLDNSTLTVRNGPALSLTGGATLTVGQPGYTVVDFATLINGSKITVQNGPLIYVDGSGSSLTVTGALVNFNGTGGNQVIVNNTIPVTDTQNGVPVHYSGGGSVNINTPTPITNLGTKGSVSFTGSVIQATNNGSVSIGVAQ
jgi:hypothetical protein